MRVSFRKIWAVIPAAGIGQRMGSEIPKQYLKLNDQMIIDITLSKLIDLNYIEGAVIAIAEYDQYWCQSSLSQHPKIKIVDGGGRRSESVFNALEFLLAHNPNVEDCWALVHDAVRPCVALEKIAELVKFTEHNHFGAILASPISDTVKRASHQRVERTEDRSFLWQAHTPQLFPATELYHALKKCNGNSVELTDEASAVEAIGGRVGIVNDRRDNIKITQPEDLPWAEFILNHQKNK